MLRWLFGGQKNRQRSSLVAVGRSMRVTRVVPRYQVIKFGSKLQRTGTDMYKLPRDIKWKLDKVKDASLLSASPRSGVGTQIPTDPEQKGLGHWLPYLIDLILLSLIF